MADKCKYHHTIIVMPVLVEGRLDASSYAERCGLFDLSWPSAAMCMKVVV